MKIEQKLKQIGDNKFMPINAIKFDFMDIAFMGLALFIIIGGLIN